MNISGLPRRRRGSSLQNSEKVLFYVFSLRLIEQCQSLPCGMPAAGCPPKFASSSSTWRRLSRSVLSSIHDLPKLWRDARPSRLVTLSRLVESNLPRTRGCTGTGLQPSRKGLSCSPNNSKPFARPRTKPSTGCSGITKHACTQLWATSVRSSLNSNGFKAPQPSQTDPALRMKTRPWKSWKAKNAFQLSRNLDDYEL